MKAGAALGLLAGLGALNALGGGREGTGKRFTGLLDMLDGGGAGASGDRFEGGGLLSILGNLFAKPLEAQDNVERIAADTNATKAVTKTLEDMAKGGALTSRLDGKDGLLSPAQKEQIVMDQIVNPDVYGIGQGGEFPEILPQPSVLSGGTAQPMPASSQATDFDVNPAMLSEGSGRMYTEMADFKPSMPSPDSFSANAPSAAAMTPPVPAPEDRNSRLAAFNRRMESVPEFYRGTEIESMYRDHILNGGLATFPQFTSGSMATEDRSVSRSPTPPALTSPSAPVLPNTPIAPQPQPKSVSDLPYADQIVAARQAVMREQITPDMLQSVFGVDFAREVMSGIQMMGGKTAVPNIPLGPLSVQRLHQTMPITRFN